MYLLILTIPFISTLMLMFFGEKLSDKGAGIISNFYVWLTFILSCFAFYEVALCGSPCTIILFRWMSSELLDIYWALLFDSLTVSMLVIVTFISSLVHLYSMEYMKGDPHLVRFMSYLTLFTFFMIVLVTSDNLVQMFLGWEGVGLASYLLINFWFTRFYANQAAMKALIVNKVGDFGFIIAIILIFYIFKSVNFDVIFSLVPYLSSYYFGILGFNIKVVNLICFFLFLGSVGKSAQVGLHVWLPDAMEGPTPVSALIHAATMVTAGVFLLIRCSPLFEFAPDILLMVTFFGGFTAFFASTCGLLQNDLKRVIAYSTCSQLGYMVFACGLSTYSVSLFHLMNHAFFKALLFLSAGVVIHSLMGEQDMRKMGSLIWLVPFVYSCVLIGSLALMGFPYLTGFYSKDVILELSYATYYIDGLFVFWLGSIAAIFTAFYSFRLIFFTFLGGSNILRPIYEKVHEGGIALLFPLFILTFASIFIGYFTKDMIIGFGSNLIESAYFNLPSNIYYLDSEFIPTSIKLIPLFFSIFGAASSILIYSFFGLDLIFLKTSMIGWLFINFISNKWYFDQIYSHYILKNIMSFGYNVSFRMMDKGIIEIFGPYGLIKVVDYWLVKFSGLATGYVYHYAFVIVVGTIGVIMFTLVLQGYYIYNRVYLFLLLSVCLLFIYRNFFLLLRNVDIKSSIFINYIVNLKLY